MRQPDTSHSPAYYQDQPQIVAAYLSDRENHPVAPPTAYLPAESQSPRQSTVIHDGSVDFPSSERTSFVHRSHPADSWDSSYHHPNRHSRHQPQPSVKPTHHIQQPAAAPVTFVSSPYPEVDPILTWASYSSSGAARKEDRIRGSWTDHSSYMSGENRNPGVARVQKRAIQDDELLSDDGQDALLMLFRMSLPIPIFCFLASLYTVFGLLFTVIVSPLRLCSCIPYLRKTSFRTQLCDLLVPQLHIHERLIGLRRACQSSSPQSVYNDGDQSSATDLGEGYSVGGLIMVLLLSSFMSFGLLLLAWTAAFFWVFAMILGNPDGTERKDDGRAAVLGVARWWQIWLGRARKPHR
ncbi:hypothetical protein BDW59DRAFT_94303 [Aspergillus cavernicola]|uniref:Uncharacterized protein n=1 Tax=Aspergillus cavernicola TaxID=176166 RepID=A0ABR4IYS9_9EURO